MQCKEFRYYNVFYGVCQEDEGPKKLRCGGAKEQIAVTVEKIAGNTGNNGGKGGQNIQKKEGIFCRFGAKFAARITGTSVNLAG